MSLQFKSFVTQPFEQVLAKLVKHEFEVEQDRLSFKRFRNKYLKDLTEFQERFADLEKIKREKIEQLTEESKEEESKKIEAEFLNKLSELCECSSELKPMDYSVVKDCKLSQLEWDILELVLINIPED